MYGAKQLNVQVYWNGLINKSDYARWCKRQHTAFKYNATMSLTAIFSRGVGSIPTLAIFEVLKR